MNGDALPTLAETQRLLARRALSATELTRRCLDRIAAYDPRLNAFLTVTAEQALAAARAADRAIKSGRAGPLAGIPLGIKDIFETQGVRTTAHSRILEHHVPTADAEVVRRLKAAGAVILGKLATHEFAFGGPAFDLPWPPARNPWDPARFTGGSSSGSGAAVAAGLCLGALGSDSGGSIRLPAGYCGVAGLKTTQGLISRRGVIPLAPSLDTVGPMAWTVEDCAILLEVLAGYDPADPASLQSPRVAYRRGLRRSLAGMRVGFVLHFHERDVPATPEMTGAIAEAARMLKDLGCKIEEVTLPPMSEFSAVTRAILAAEAYALHEATLKARVSDYSRAFRLRVLPGGLMRAADYLAAQRRRTVLAAKVNACFARYDALLTGVIPRPAPLLEAEKPEETALSPSLVTPANVAGIPALAVCVGYSANGLPLGCQLLGPAFGEASILCLGHQLEMAAGTRSRRPRL